MLPDDNGAADGGFCLLSRKQPGSQARPDDGLVSPYGGLDQRALAVTGGHLPFHPAVPVDCGDVLVPLAERFIALGSTALARGGMTIIAMLARDGRHVGNAFITLPSQIRERLWRRVEENADPPAPAHPQKDAGGAEWVRPGIVGRVRFLKGEDSLRHATLKDWREEDRSLDSCKIGLSEFAFGEIYWEENSGQSPPTF